MRNSILEKGTHKLVKALISCIELEHQLWKVEILMTPLLFFFSFTQHRQTAYERTLLLVLLEPFVYLLIRSYGEGVNSIVHRYDLFTSLHTQLKAILERTGMGCILHRYDLFTSLDTQLKQIRSARVSPSRKRKQQKKCTSEIQHLLHLMRFNDVIMEERNK